MKNSLEKPRPTLFPRRDKLAPKQEPINQTRRDLLHAAIIGTILTTAALTAGPEKKTQQSSLTESHSAKTIQKIPRTPDNTEQRQQTAPTELQQLIEQDDADIAGKTFEEQLELQDHITIDRATKKAVYDKWYKRYAPEGKDHLGLLQSLERMQPWIAEMKEQFRAHGVPEEYVYLCIPESHFTLTAVSSADARGPYQFKEETATSRVIGLKVISSVYDERLDPIKSAEGCAKHLRESYENFNHDWELALADYNGGFTNRYAEVRPRKKRSYDDFLAYREKAINVYMTELSTRMKHHTVQKGETLQSIAKNYDTTAQDLQKRNGMHDSAIRPGQQLQISISNSRFRKKLLEKLSDSSENLNYPEKFLAVIDVIKNHKLAQKYPPKPLHYKYIALKKTETAEFHYSVEKGDGMMLIARKTHAHMRNLNSHFSLSLLVIQRLLQQQNNITDPRRISEGQKLVVRIPVSHMPSLKTLATQHALPEENLKRLNPAVIKATEALPASIAIRIPHQTPSVNILAGRK